MEPVARSPSIRIDLTHTDLGRKQRQKVTCLNRHKLRKLAIEQSRDEAAYFRMDSAPDYKPLSVPVKGTLVVEVIAPYRQGVFSKQVPGRRFDHVLVDFNGHLEISSLYLLKLQVEQLKLF